MNLSTLCWRASIFLAYPAILFTVLLYFYPLFLGCSFPEPLAQSTEQCILDSTASRAVNKSLGKAPFRLLALGDPQLEGDSSLPRPEDPPFSNLHHLRQHFEHNGLSGNTDIPFNYLRNIFRKDVPRLIWSYRKRLDLFGNDYYLAHIYRTLYWWLQPTHVVVLGDLLGSQWISDPEFARRSTRFWDIVFRHGHRVDHSISGINFTQTLGQDPVWSRRVINVAGNHDIGYAGDITSDRLDRFEDAFGKANWEVKFRLPPRNSSTFAAESVPELRLVVLNNMLLDGPALTPDLQKQVYDFIGDPVMSNSHPVEDRTGATILLTHIPLYKKGGVCRDGPFIDYSSHGVREQNHLSLRASKAILEGIYGLSGNPNAPAQGLGRNGVILDGHDHEGCDVLHYIPSESQRDEDEWTAVPWTANAASEAWSLQSPSIREITVRSMMGSFGGNAGLLSAWFDDKLGEWRFEYDTCSLGVQHIWWAVHVLDVITILTVLASALAKAYESVGQTATAQKTKNPPKKHLKPKSSKLHLNGDAVASVRPDSPSSAGRRRTKKPKR